MTTESSTPVSSSVAPKKIGILIVGLGGNNGVTLLAGHRANQAGLAWETGGTPGRGRVQAPNWSGCITQLPPKGVHGGVGFQGLYELADAANAAVGGWDIRSTPLGDALYESRVLDYDLVRQVCPDLNQIQFLPGIFNADFLGESQHATATHIVDTSNMNTLWEQVQHVRNDIQTFVHQNQIDGHTTVIWSASVERNAQVASIRTADQLIQLLQSEAKSEISPSIIYATAAALEGCSFVNGGSQNTLGPALAQLFESSYRKTITHIPNVSNQPAYLLGTDFKAGQTKCKTCLTEYLRAMGLTPRVIASSNHLGNNDMLNLTAKTTLRAKMRVKHSIFGPWQEDDLDHQVSVMYVPYMGDEKRDVVEYTSTAFLHQEHTMLTYTRCMDSVLCVPLMIDGAVWCDYFARNNAPSNNVAKATAYLFKVPEGGALGVDPGFHHQMETLRRILEQTKGPPGARTSKMGIQELLHKGLIAGILTEDQVAALRSLTR